MARNFCGRAQDAQAALLDGVAGVVRAPGRRPRVVFEFTIEGGRIVPIHLRADPERLRALDVVILDA